MVLVFKEKNNAKPKKSAFQYQKEKKKKETIRFRAEINEIENRKKTAKIDKVKSWSFEKISKTDKPLAKLTKKRENTNY